MLTKKYAKIRHYLNGSRTNVALNFLIEIVAIVLYIYDYTYYANLIIVLKIIKDGICKNIANIMLRKPKNNKKGETEYSKWFEKRPGKKKQIIRSLHILQKHDQSSCHPNDP